jgi:IclR family transcriptional regulator, pca regulon regulatory protein
MRTTGRRANTVADYGHPMTDETTDDGQLPTTESGLAKPPGAAAAAKAARSPAGTPIRDSDFVQSLDRGLAVIRAFGPDRARLSLSEVARATGLTRAAARRFLLTLVKLGYVRSDGREFSLRPRVLELGYAYLSGLELPEVAQPHLEALSKKLHESSSVSVLDGHYIVYVARAAAKRIMTVAIRVGTRFPAYAASMGRVLLAGLSPQELDNYLAEATFDALTERTVTDPDRLRAILREVDSQGYAIVDQELEDGLRAIAAPIHDASGAVIAAVNVSAHAGRYHTPDAMLTQLLPDLLKTAALIESDLKAIPGGSSA